MMTKFLMLQKFTKFENESMYKESQNNIQFIINIITSIRNLIIAVKGTVLDDLNKI